MSVGRGLKVAVVLMILTSTNQQTAGGPFCLDTVTLDEGFSLRMNTSWLT